MANRIVETKHRFKVAELSVPKRGQDLKFHVFASFKHLQAANHYARTLSEEESDMIFVVSGNKYASVESMYNYGKKIPLTRWFDEVIAEFADRGFIQA